MYKPTLVLLAEQALFFVSRVPGSHRLEADHPRHVWSDDEKQNFHLDAVAAEGSVGSVLLFDCRLYHTKAPNDTDEERLAVQVRYGAGWYYTRLNHAGEAGQDGAPLSKDVLAQMPEAVRPRFAEYTPMIHKVLQ